MRNSIVYLTLVTINAVVFILSKSKLLAATTDTNTYLLSPTIGVTETFILPVQITPTDTPIPTRIPSPVISKNASKPTIEEVLRLINDFRQKNGKQSLSINNGLNSFAQSRSQYLADIGRLDNHQGFRALSDNKMKELNLRIIGEDIGFTGDSSASSVLNMFITSTYHREILLNGHYSVTGIGLTFDSKKHLWVDIIFGGY